MTVADLKELLKNKDDDDIVLVINHDGGTYYLQDNDLLFEQSFSKLAKQNGWIKE